MWLFKQYIYIYIYARHNQTVQIEKNQNSNHLEKMYSLGSKKMGVNVAIVTAWGDGKPNLKFQVTLGWLVKCVEFLFTPDIFNIISTLTCLTSKFASV